MSNTRKISISDNAVRKIGKLITADGNPALMLRVTVNGGGCQGFEYKLDLDDTQNDDDLIFEKDGIKVVTDPVSLEFLDGSEVDFVDELIGASFKIKNPNATSSCGCGTSFSI